MTIYAYGFWLAWLTLTGRLEPDALPEQRMTKDAARAFLASMEARLAPMTVQSRIGHLARMMKALAPDQDWGWLSRAAHKLRVQAVPVREKRHRMQDVGALVDLGCSLMRKASATDDHFALSRAVLYRDGLMIALLAMRPFRRRSFTSLAIGQHLVKDSESWWLDFEPGDVKNKTAVKEITFPAELVDALMIYLQQHRPVLLKPKARMAESRAEPTALWVGKGGRPLGDSAISLQIQRHTKEAFGKPINLHLFRDCAVTSIAIHDPAHVRDAQVILGHSNFETTERHYNQAKGLEASERFQQHVGKMKAEFKKR